jgi:hypothetical protein
MLEVGLYAHLTGDAGVSALVAGRVYPLLLPQSPTLPALVYQRISTNPLGATHDGANHMTRVRMQIRCHGATLLAAKQVADAVRGALDGFAGTMGDVTVQSCLRADESDDDEPDVEAYSVRADYMIVFDEA